MAQTAAGLPNGGITTHYAVTYDNSLSAADEHRVTMASVLARQPEAEQPARRLRQSRRPGRQQQQPEDRLRGAVPLVPVHAARIRSECDRRRRRSAAIRRLPQPDGRYD